MAVLELIETNKPEHRYKKPSGMTRVNLSCSICSLWREVKLPVAYLGASTHGLITYLPIETVAMNTASPLPQIAPQNHYVSVMAEYFSRCYDVVALPEIEPNTTANATFD